MPARTGLVLFARVTLAATLAFGLAGCGDDEPKRSGSGAPKASASASASGSGSAAPVDPSATAGTATPGAPGAPGDPGVAGEGGTATGADKQVCADQEKLVAESTRKFGEAVVQASQGGNEQATVNAVKTLFSEWAAGMRTQAGKAQSAELKQALTEYAQGLEKVNSQINGVADLDKLGDLNTSEIEAATDKVLRICG
jgi:hypothetical protein